MILSVRADCFHKHTGAILETSPRRRAPARVAWTAYVHMSSAKKVSEKAKPESYQSALAQFCSSALRADAKKKATKAPLASAVKKRASASAVLNGAKKRPKAPLVGDGTKFTPAQQFAGPLPGCVFKLGPAGQGYYPDTPASTRPRSDLLKPQELSVNETNCQQPNTRRLREKPVWKF